MQQIRRSIASPINTIRPRILPWALSLVLPLIVATGTSDLDNVRIRLVNGSSIRGTIESIDADGRIIGSRILKDIQLGQITSIETRRKSNEADGGCHVMLISGGFIVAPDVTIEDDSVLLSSPTESNLSIPIEAIRGIVWNQTPTVKQTFADRSSENDYVIVKTKRGDQLVSGFLESIDKSHVYINFKGKSRKIGREKILAIVTAALEESTPDGIKAEFTKTDGSRMFGVINEYRNNNFQLAITNTFSIPIPSTQLAKIVIQSDRIRYLSDMDPVREEAHSQFAAARQWQRNKSLLGNTLKLKYDSNGRILSFDKGIGARSFTSIVYANDNEYEQFRAVVGIDIETGGQGDCEMVVEGDGIRLWSKRVTGTSDPEPIVVDIVGIREVTLMVLPGEKFDLADHADWADARFTKLN